MPRINYLVNLSDTIVFQEHKKESHLFSKFYLLSNTEMISFATNFKSQ